MITYVDGLGQSGSKYADKYAEENLISTTCIAAPDRFREAVSEHERKRAITINGVVVIDDIVVTGRSLSQNVERFLKENMHF